MKTKEELNALKEEVEALNKKLHELTEEELAQVFGGGPKIISPILRLLSDFIKRNDNVCKGSVAEIPLDSDEKLSK